MTAAPGTVVQISERSAEDGKFQVRVRFPDAEYDVEVTDPADEAAEQELAWYFEEHLRYPFLDKDRERDAVQRIGAYGEALFGQVFGGKANHSYLMLAERSFDGCRLEISGSAALHRLHWESLRDPEHPDPPLGVRLPVTRHVEAQPSQFAVRDDLPTLNILVVTARPGGSHDVGYRTISQPLLDALRNSDQPVTVDLVRPGTWDALRAHLAEATRQHGSGWYQVIHFDLHGAFTDYETLAQGASQGQLRFSSAALPPFDGQRGFLFFETERDDVAHPIPAETVASSLAEHRIPVAVLNACQSAMQTISEAGLAQRLAEAGVPVTVGMAYSVTVTAAERSMPVLYQHLAEGADPVAAVHAARRELFEHRGRLAYYDQELDLEDWMLPVVFGQRPLQVELRAMTDAEQTEFDERSAAVGDEPATEYGFVGRDLDIQAIERRLLAGKDTNELLVRGMAGAGKSTLLAYLAWWWQRTGLVGQVFRFSYEDRAWTAHQIVRDIRAKLFTPAEHAAADSRSEAAQLEQVARRLRAHRHLLVLDNAESITAAPASIPHALSADEQANLKTLLSRLRGGRTLILLGSREPETWLTSGRAGPGIYPLPGLDPQASSVLVDRILERHGATRHLADLAERGALDELVKLLGGYPLPLTVVLPVLATSKPSEVLAELREGGPGADPTGLIHRAIEYSHGKLDESLQNSLLLLAPFTSVITTGPVLKHYQELLRQDESVQRLGQIDLAAALGRAVAVGLGDSHPQVNGMIRVQPVLPYFLRSRLRDQPAVRSATNEAHYQLYIELAAEFYKLLSSESNPEQRALGKAITRSEYANLTNAFNYGLYKGQSVTTIVKAIDEYLAQSQQHEIRRELLDRAIEKVADAAGDAQHRELAQLHDLAGAAAFDQRRFEEAISHYQTELKISRAIGNKAGQGSVHHMLGYIAYEQRRLTEASDHYHQSLALKLELGDRRSAAYTYHQLGMVAQGQGRLDEAQAHYQQALDIFLECGDQHVAATTYHQLGRVAQVQGRLDEAQAHYRQALDIFAAFGDQQRSASVHHQLGMVALQQRRLDEAQAHYRRALNIRLNLNIRYTTANTYYQLGVVAYEQHRPDEARAHFQKALDIYLEFGDSHNASIAAVGIGTVLADLGRHNDAIKVLLSATASTHQDIGKWPPNNLRWLRIERDAIGAETFTALLYEVLSKEQANELTAAVNVAGEPTEEGEPGSGASVDRKE